jgi:Rieske Fe-S protein
MTQQTEDDTPPLASRRVVLAGAGAAAIAVLTGCTTYDQNAPAGGDDGDDEGGDDGVDPDPTGSAGTPGANPPKAGPSAPGPAPNAFASTADIPVGGGTLFGQRQVVITQPQAGTFKAFTAVCTHAGCVVAEVKNGTINCDCHGSRYKAADGTEATGPASRPLKPVTITVTGTDIHLA